MANERQSKQQMSDRAQTNSTAQQGDWQPSSQGGAGRAGHQVATGYGQSGQAGARGSVTARRSQDPGYYGSYYGGGGPLSMMRRLTDEMDRLFESFGMGRGFPSPFGGIQGELRGSRGLQSLWSPSVDVCERGGKFCVSVDLPGIKKDDVDVQVENDAITIQGQRSDERTTDERGYYQRERSHGSFHRVIPLPEGADAENATATFRDGVLQIEMPVATQSARGRRLEIRDAGSPGDTTTSTTTRTSEGGFVTSGDQGGGGSGSRSAGTGSTTR